MRRRGYQVRVLDLTSSWNCQGGLLFSGAVLDCDVGVRVGNLVVIGIMITWYYQGVGLCVLVALRKFTAP